MAAPAAARPSRRHVAAWRGCPRRSRARPIPPRGQQPAEHDQPRSRCPGTRCVRHGSPREHQPTAADGEQEEQTDDAASASIWMYRFWTPHSRPGAGNASATTFGSARARPRDTARRRRRAPIAATPRPNRVVLPDPEADVGQHRPLRVCLSTPCGGSSPRTPRKRTNSSSESARIAVTPPATTARVRGRRGSGAARVEAASCGDRQNQSAEREPSSGCE